jgi:hypothetical protein
VPLAFKALMFRLREARSNRVRGALEQVVAPARDHQGRLTDLCETVGGQVAISQARRVVGKRV